MASLLVEDVHLPTLEDHFRFRQSTAGMLNVLVINDAMRDSGLTIAALAAACDVSELAVERWLKSESIPRPCKLTKLAGALDMAEELLLNIGYVPGALDHDAPELLQ